MKNYHRERENYEKFILRTHNLTLASEFSHLASRQLNIPLFFLVLTTGLGGRPLALMRNILTRYIFSFISLSPFVGRGNELILSQAIVLLLIKFLSQDGQRSSNASRSYGDGSTDPSLDSECARADETKRRAEATSSTRGQ